MKKNKTIAYALAATLLVGGTFAGTKAWFSDKVETSNGIQITMGTLDLELKENGADKEGQNQGWKLVRDNPDNESGTKNGEARSGESGSEFTEIRPGDTFTRTFTVKNNGSLDQMVSVEKIAEGDLNPLFSLDVTGDEAELNNNKEFRLNSGDTKTLTLTLTPDKEAIDNKYNAESKEYLGEGYNVFNLNDALGEIKVTGRQINADKTQLSTEHKADK